MGRVRIERIRALRDVRTSIPGTWREVAGLDGGRTQPRWSSDGRHIFYVSRDSRLMSALLTPGADARSVEVNTPTPLFQARLAVGGNVAVGSSNARAHYVVARDGRFLMITPVDDAVATPITIMLNWTAALAKK
jgi:hypothetical protein